MINETKENDQFNEARIKYITSNDTITARKLYGHFFDFFPTHKIFVATNHKPIVRGTDEGIWRRLHLIPFTVTIAKEAVEKDFRERRLVPELAGILNWAIEGVLQYRRDGLNPPAVVRAATDDYRHDMDVVGQWIEECCVRDSNASVVTGQAYGNYSTWSSREIGWTLHVQRWRRNLSERGYLPAKGTHGQRMILGCVDGFDQDEAESKRDERAVILRRLLASKCDTLEAFELADSLFNACPCLVECFRKEGGHILGVGSIRDCRTYSALARGVAV